jgi:hypothetical protein
MAAFPVTAGTVVEFDGVALRGAISFSLNPGSCGVADTTGTDNVVKGAGLASVVLRTVEPGPVEPATAEVVVIGDVVTTTAALGRVATLSMSGPWGSISGEAFVTGYPVSGSVGEVPRQTISFQFTGL